MPRREPERTCIVTRIVRAPDELIRFVVGPGSEVVPDLNGRLPGRGAWVTATAEAVNQAVKKKLFARAFKGDVKASPTMADQIDEALRRDLRQALSLAKKAGVVVSGFAKVEAAIGGGALAGLVHAIEAAPDGRRKLAGALRKRFGDATSNIPVVEELSNDELDMALGRSHVIHAALVAGAGSDGFLARWRRLRAFRASTAAEAGLPREAGASEDSEPAGT